MTAPVGELTAGADRRKARSLTARFERVVEQPRRCQKRNEQRLRIRETVTPEFRNLFRLHGIRRRRYTSQPRVSEAAQPRSATLGTRPPRRINPEGVAQPGASLWNPFRVRWIRGDRNPGWRGCAADPGLCCETPLGLMAAALGGESA